MPTLTPNPEPQADPLSGFKEAFEKYQRCQADFVALEGKVFSASGAHMVNALWRAMDLARKTAAEWLW
jgi:hypothetical protein